MPNAAANVAQLKVPVTEYEGVEGVEALEG